MNRYFCTFTLSTDVILKLTIKNQYRLCKKWIDNFVTHFDETHYVFELTKKGNIHIHALVSDNDPEMEESFISLLASEKLIRLGSHRVKLFGFSKIDKIIKDNGILDYMIKDVKRTEYVFRHFGIMANAMGYHKRILSNIQAMILGNESGTDSQTITLALAP